MKEAQGIINKEAWRASTRELQPYGSTSSSSLDEVKERRASTGQQEGERERQKVRFDQRGVKRTQEEEEEEGEGTEVDEDEFQDPASITFDHTNQNQAQGRGQDEFPPVFQSPNLSQPELFHNNQQRQTRFAVPDLPDRMKRNLPARRALGKSVSAPVGRLGFGGMDVDQEDGEDGFDISEWAGKEDF
jgi:hypothetical protein